MDPDKGIEQAVYAKNKGIDYSYADTSGGIGNLGPIGTGKGKLKFNFFFREIILRFFFSSLKEERQSLLMLRILLTTVTKPLSVSLVNPLQKDLPKNQKQ